MTNQTYTDPKLSSMGSLCLKEMVFIQLRWPYTSTLVYAKEIYIFKQELRQLMVEDSIIYEDSIINVNKIQGKRANWLSGEKGRTGYRRKRTNLLSWGKGWTVYQGKRDQLSIGAKGTNWLSREKGQLTIRGKGTNCLSRQNEPTGYQSKRDQI